MEKNEQKAQGIVENPFPWNGSQLVLEEYKKENIRVENTGEKTGKAIIFFSSNGIYYPETEDSFRKSIVEKDRYEFENISRDEKIQKEFELIIFVRDVYKQWYVNGINERVNSVDKLCEYLQDITKGYLVTTCGLSAGGYLSMLIGNMINADKIFSFSGQFYLWNELTSAPLLRENQSIESKSKYYDISNLISRGYYFYPAKVDVDIFQSSFVKNNEGIKKLPINQEWHGSTVAPECYVYILTMSRDEVDCFFEALKGKAMVSRKQISKRVLPFSKRIILFPKNVLKATVKKFKKIIGLKR